MLALKLNRVSKTSCPILQQALDPIVKDSGQSSRSERSSQMLTIFGRFGMITPVWIPRWLWKYAQSVEGYSKGALLFIKDIHLIHCHLVQTRSLAWSQRCQIPKRCPNTPGPHNIHASHAAMLRWITVNLLLRVFYSAFIDTLWAPP